MPDVREAAVIALIALAAIAVAYRVPALSAAVFGRSNG